MGIAVKIAEVGEFSWVKQTIGTTTTGQIALIEQDIKTGKTRVKPLIVKDDRIYAGEVIEDG